MLDTAVIMAAGKCTRMLPLTENTHKSMLEVKGKKIIDHILSRLIDNNITNIILIINHGKQELINYISSNYPHLNTKFIEQPEKNGTAKAVELAEPHVNNHFLVLNGDILFNGQLLPSMIQKLKDTNSMILSAKKVDDPQRYGIFELDGHKVTKLIEKPEHPPTNLANAGVYIFSKKIFDAIRLTPLSQRREYEITDSIVISLKQGEHAYCHIYDGIWMSFERPDDLKKSANINFE